MQTIHEQETEKEIEAVEAVVHADTELINKHITNLQEEITALRSILEKTN
jgi:hypothetical protein